MNSRRIRPQAGRARILRARYPLIRHHHRHAAATAAAASSSTSGAASTAASAASAAVVQSNTVGSVAYRAADALPPAGLPPPGPPRPPLCVWVRARTRRACASCVYV